MVSCPNGKEIRAYSPLPPLTTAVLTKDSIVAVHGLNPKKKENHAEKTWMANYKLWLRDFLAPKLPYARVLLFGYNSNVTNDNNAMNTWDHAVNLLNRLDTKRTQDLHRPIVFIAHSLGGLVVKKALVEARLNQPYDAIREATYGIAFFATPHLGGNYAALGKILSDIVNVVLGNSMNELVKDLQRSSLFLGRLNEDFRHQLEDHYFVNFFETKSYKGIGAIVDRDSAKLNLPGSREALIPVDADHNDICKFATEDGEYEQVEQNIKRLVEVEVPHNPNRNFVGRENTVERTIEILTSSKGSQPRIALYGLGGAPMHQMWMFLQWFVIAFGEATGGRWVMIIDHADDLQSLTLTQAETNGKIRLQSKRLLDYIPDCSHGSVLLTTRNKKVAASFAGRGRLEQVLPFNKKDSKELVHRFLEAKHCRGGGTDELIDVLNHFPLAIVQATSFIQGNGITVQTYIQRYRDNKNNALELFGNDLMDADDTDAVTTTWMISFKQIQTNNLYAADLFSMMAYLDHQDIPESMLRELDNTKSPLQFEKACGELKAFSFISESYSIPSSSSPSADTISHLYVMQPIVQLVMRHWLREHGQTQTWVNAALIAASKTFPPAEGSKEHWKAFETYIPHVQAILDCVDEYTGSQQYKTDLLHNVSWYFRVRGFHETAHRMGHEAWMIRKQILGDENERTLASVHSLARIMFEQGKLDESEIVQKPAMERCREILGSEHPSTLRSQGHLAAILGMQERYEEAHELQKSILEISQRTQGDSPMTWLAMRDLAVTLCYLNRMVEAESLQSHVLEARKKYPGDDHPETLIIMKDLVSTCIAQSRFDKAEDILKKVLEGSKRTLGQIHPHTIGEYQALADVLKNQKKRDHARTIEDAIRRIQQDSSHEETQNLKRPKAKRTMSHSSGMGYKDVEGLGLGLTLMHGENMKEKEQEDSDEEGFEDEDEEAVGEDDASGEEMKTIKKALILMMRSMMSLPVFNIVQVASTEDVSSQPPDDTENTSTVTITDSESVEDVTSGPERDDFTEADPSIELSLPRSDSAAIIQSHEKPIYSKYKSIRSVQKKIERNANKETADALLKGGIDILETSKAKLKDIEVPWPSGTRDTKSKQGETEAGGS
ncbi:hypothetical protein N0V90_002918 [Kalmusia sp. IMI 367209]|nr:hypothetical protein N0V90_002918 [Kalmusia sp. IMI 367209]